MNNLGILDVINSIKRAPAVAYLATSDLRARYKRSYLGPIWVTLTTLLGVVALGFVWSQIYKIDTSTLLPSLTIGIVVWQLIAGCISESTTAITRYSNTIRNLKTSFLFFPWLVVAKSLVNFSHNVIIIFIILLIYPPKLGYTQLLVIPGIIIVALNLLWISAFISIVAARFRDVESLITALLPILFFITPVLFKPDQLSSIRYLEWVNPLSWLVAVIRDPILGVIPSGGIYFLSISMAIFGCITTVALLNKVIKKIPFWL